ncbi:Carbohydrate esterase 4 protein [Nowakowskiella sp. JEL0407]|nr:Carbohydrate esterase 4 protein [Nowakowskiella sp. JEL0407]
MIYNSVSFYALILCSFISLIFASPDTLEKRQNCAAVYSACGGQGLPTIQCCSGSVCQYSNQFYSQCVPSTPSVSPIPSQCVQLYGQCGGQTYTGYSRCCDSVCVFVNSFYSQCQAVSTSRITTTTTTARVTTTNRLSTTISTPKSTLTTIRSFTTTSLPRTKQSQSTTTTIKASSTLTTVSTRFTSSYPQTTTKINTSTILPITSSKTTTASIAIRTTTTSSRSTATTPGITTAIIRTTLTIRPSTTISRVTAPTTARTSSTSRIITTTRTLSASSTPITASTLTTIKSLSTSTIPRLTSSSRLSESSSASNLSTTDEIETTTLQESKTSTLQEETGTQSTDLTGTTNTSLDESKTTTPEESETTTLEDTSSFLADLTDTTTATLEETKTTTLEETLSTDFTETVSFSSSTAISTTVTDSIFTSTPVPTGCAPIVIEDFSNGSEFNNFGGYSGTDGSGTYSIRQGSASWSPIISADGAYWFTQIFAEGATAQCHNFSQFGNSAALSIELGKESELPATLSIGVDVGCGNTHSFYEIGAIELGVGNVTKQVELNLLPKLDDVVNLASVKAILVVAKPSVPNGTNFVIGSVKMVCSSNPPIDYCGPNGGGIDMERLPGVRPRVVERCSRPGQFALTFDDGPKLYEDDIVNKLNAFGIKATFFMNTNNWADATTEPYTSWIRHAYESGHQIASHTATHTDLTTLNQTEMIAELQRAENSFNTAMIRPPYGSYNDLVLSTLDQLGYNTAVLWNLDTNDWQHPDDLSLSIDAAKHLLEVTCPNPGSAAVIELGHSTLPQSLDFLDFIVPYVQSRGYTFVTVAECLSMEPYKL